MYIPPSHMCLCLSFYIPHFIFYLFFSTSSFFFHQVMHTWDIIEVEPLWFKTIYPPPSLSLSSFPPPPSLPPSSFLPLSRYTSHSILTPSICSAGNFRLGKWCMAQVWIRNGLSPPVRFQGRRWLLENHQGLGSWRCGFLWTYNKITHSRGAHPWTESSLSFFNFFLTDFSSISCLMILCFMVIWGCVMIAASHIFHLGDSSCRWWHRACLPRKSLWSKTDRNSI